MLCTEHMRVEIGDCLVCRDLTVRFQPGECWALLGRNGTGKTTLLHTLAGLSAPASGTVLLGDDDLKHVRRRQIAQSVALLPQSTHDPFPNTVWETAMLGRYPHRSLWQSESINDAAAARNALSQVGLDHLHDRSVHTLSGGERRRLAIATVLTQEPQTFLLDEPTNHLDLPHQMSTLRLFHSLAANRQCTPIVVLHDINLAFRFFDHILMLFGDGNYCHGPTDSVFTESNLQRLLDYPVTVLETAAGRVFLTQ